MPSPYKLFVTDLDGTLLDSSRRIPQANLNAVRRLVTSGVPVTVFTGRSLNSAIDYVRELGVEVPVVFQNGALIWEPLTHTEFLRVPLSGTLAFSITERARRHGFDTLLYRDFYSVKDMWMERSDWTGNPFAPYVEHNAWRTRHCSDLLDVLAQETEVAQLAVIAPIAPLERFREEVRQAHGEQLSSVISTVRGDFGFFEVFGPRVSKGTALHFLLDHYGVTAEETVFIGDSYNDVEIMRAVGMPVAVANAPHDIRNLCRMVVPDNDSCGVADAIARIFFGTSPG